MPADSRPLDRTKLLAARYRAANLRPYLATALYSLSVVSSEGVPTMGVDRHWRCYVNPAFVEANEVPELAGVWVHEVSHLLRDHHGRASRLSVTDRQDHHRVNIAQDCEINDDIISDRLPLPAGRMEPSAFGLPNGQLFEQYLPHIPATVHLDCGSGAHGAPRPWERPGATMPVSDVEADAIRRQTAQAIRAHVRARGTVPAGWRRWADEVLEPTIDWRAALTGSIREAAAWASGAVDYTYRRPSRRSAALPGLVLPSLRRPLPRVAVVIDTSGSMGDDEMAAVLAEVHGVLRSVGVGGNRVTVLACDADVHTVRRVASVGEIELAGGGGTDMRVGIKTAMAAAPPPNIVIVLTDGLTPWPGAPIPAARLIAAIVGDCDDPPSWIETIRIPQQ